MLIRIIDIIGYGRHYSDMKENEVDDIWWFDKNSYSIIERDTLINEYNYNYEKMLENFYENIIPIFKVDIIALEREYISKKNDRQISNYFKDVSNKDYDITFKIFVEENSLSSNWYEFEKEALTEAAIKWCTGNNIIFKQ